MGRGLLKVLALLLLKIIILKKLVLEINKIISKHLEQQNNDSQSTTTKIFWQTCVCLRLNLMDLMG